MNSLDASRPVAHGDFVTVSDPYRYRPRLPGIASAAIEQTCTRCVMNSIADPSLEFDASGVCRYCRDYDALIAKPAHAPATRHLALQEMVTRVRERARGQRYDCVLGLSGGVDSSYAVYFAAKELGLRPLVVHLDNGWNTELAVRNIEQLLRTFRLDLVTHVIKWEEFRELQRSYFLASVVDVEATTDHAIIAALVRTAKKFGISTVMTGDNFASESTLPPGWNHRKTDLRNLRAIHRRHSTSSLATFPTISSLEMLARLKTGNLAIERPLFYTSYTKTAAVKDLVSVGWTPYEGKHYESVFTRFYQGYYLPEKFGIDKRLFHFARLVAGGQLTRDDALASLSKPIYTPELLELDRDFVLKKLQFSPEQWQHIMSQAPRAHSDFATDESLLQGLFKAKRVVTSLARKTSI